MYFLFMIYINVFFLHDYLCHDDMFYPVFVYLLVTQKVVGEF